MRKALCMLGCAALMLSWGCKKPHAASDRVQPLRAAPNGVCDGAKDVDVLRHRVHLDVELSPAAIRGHGTVSVRARGHTEAIWLDAQDLELISVADAQTALAFETRANKLCVSLRKPLSPGEELSLQLRWRVPIGSRGLHVYPDQIWAAYNTSAWMPTRQDPAQRATLQLSVKAPAGYQVVASGQRLEPSVVDSVDGESRFTLERASPPFLYAFVVGKLVQAELQLPGLKLRALGPQGTDLSAALSATAVAAQYLLVHVTEPVPGALYTQVFVHGEAAQEAAGMALLSESSLQDLARDPSEDWLFTHELAHQWFGWLVPCADFADFWLNEGFATFIVGAVKQQRWGASAYEAERARWRVRSAKVHAEGRDAPVALSRPGAAVIAPTEGQLQARGVTYFRGALVLHRLRELLGDEMFWLGVRRYLAQGAGAGYGARTEDLRAALEAASHQELGPFFERWVYSVASDL